MNSDKIRAMEIFKTLRLYFLCSIIATTSVFAQSTPLKDLIRDPIVSRRCKALLGERDQKVKIKQRLNALLLRNKKLQKSLKPTQEITMKRLQLNEIQLRNNYRLTEIKVKAMDEDIIRKGCPGVTL